MGLVEVDVGNPDLFKAYEARILPKGPHLFEVANDLIVEPAKSSDNNIINVELRCQDEDENKSTPVWDIFTLVTNAQGEKAIKSKAINEARLAQFAVACGVRTQAQIEAGEGIPLHEFKGCRCNAITKVEIKPDPTTLDEEGQPVQRKRARIVRYVFEEGKVA